jgi:general secretion pathway protein A
MYLEHFGLREFPFSLAPDPRYLYLSAQHREALAHLLYGVQSEGGFVQLTGEVGTGKTTVCRTFLEQLPPGTRAALILNPALTAEELLETVCDEFGIPPADGGSGVKAALDRINRFLLEVHAAGGRAVLVIDEAQNLDAAVLEQVRLLTNLETSRTKLLQVILMGQPELRLTLARPELRQLAQRVTARHHLRPLTREETAAYVRHRLEVAGCHDELFPAALVGRLRRLSRGVPRLINIICDRALLGAFAQGLHRVDRATLNRAAREVAGGDGWGVVPWRALALGLAAALALAAVLLVVGVRDRTATAPAPRPAPAAPGAAKAPATARADRPAAAPAAPAVPASPASPASPAPAVVSGVLRALLEQPEAQREDEAWRWLYRLWGVRARDGENGCTQAAVHGLDCLRGEGGLERLRRLDRPAIVRVYDSAGAARWLVLERLHEGQATFAAGGARTAVDAGKLGGYAIGEFTLLWRAPEGTRGTLAPGDRGPGVNWLARRLGAPVAPAAADAAFDEALAARVRAFQRANGLEADGVAGPQTLMLLDRDPAPGTPTLGSR